MGSKYTSQSISGYNSSAPSDDGSQTDANKVKWSTIKGKLADPVKTLAEAMNTALVSALDTSARSIVANDSAVAADNGKTIEIASTVTAALTVTLSDAATMGAGYMVTVFNSGSGTVTVARTGSDTINGATSASLQSKQGATFRVNSATNGYVSSDAGVVTPTATQTLTNKTLTNPTINGFTGNTAVVNIGSGQIYKDTAGKVGIGTASPTYKLHVSGGDAYINTVRVGGSNSNVILGNNALNSIDDGYSNVAIGADALSLNTSGNSNIAVGGLANYSVTTGEGNVAIGVAAGYSATTGGGNVAVGGAALYGNTSADFNTAIGYLSLGNIFGPGNLFTNCSGLGYEADVTGSNQVQLGNSSTTTYAYGSVQNRSDERDKADIRDTTLGLSFICSLRPRDFRWDYREDYKETVLVDGKPTVVEHLRDGSKKRSRYHHGLVAQEVKATLDSLGIDFGGFQDHSVKGGQDVQSIGYSELIAPLIKAVQELSARVAALEAR